MPARVWTALAGLIAVLLIAVVGLDQWQSRRGEPSLFGSADYQNGVVAGDRPDDVRPVGRIDRLGYGLGA